MEPLNRIREIAKIDPNLRTNRIPSNSELPILRSLANSKHHVIQEIDLKIQEIKKVQGATREPEESLIQQRNDIIEEFKHLDGLIHPIRRAHDDILRHIFEYVFRMTVFIERRWTQPTSQVCQRWRAIALNTPLLSSQISPPFKNHPSDVPEYWTLASGRVKSVPATITFAFDFFYPPETNLLLHCPLDKIQNVRQFDIYIEHQMANFLLEWLPSQEKTIRNVTLYGNFDSWDDSVEFASIAPILSVLKPAVFRSMDLEYTVPQIQHTFPSIQELYLGTREINLNFSPLLMAMESVKVLELDYTYADPAYDSLVPHIYTSKALEYLRILGPDLPAWMEFQFPALTKVFLSQIDLAWAAPNLFLKNEKIQSVTILVHQTRGNETVSSGISKLEELEELLNKQGKGHSMELFLQVIDLHSPSTQDENPKLAGRPWTLITDEQHYVFRLYRWK